MAVQLGLPVRAASPASSHRRRHPRHEPYEASPVTAGKFFGSGVLCSVMDFCGWGSSSIRLIWNVFRWSVQQSICATRDFFTLAYNMQIWPEGFKFADHVAIYHCLKKIESL